jgi:hypothetical protein
LYAVFSLVSLFPIIGALGRFITMATILAPILGILLGPYIGVTTVSIGGFIAWTVTQTGAFSFVSFIPGAATAFAAGLLTNNKRAMCVALYLLFLLPMAFFPTIGPVWLYPLYLWFHLVGLFLLVSPASAKAWKFIRDKPVEKLTVGILLVALVSTLIGQAAGGLLFELFFYPVYSGIQFWRVEQWQLQAFVYPLERGIITVLAAVLGTPLIKAVQAFRFRIGDP